VVDVREDAEEVLRKLLLPAQVLEVKAGPRQRRNPLRATLSFELCDGDIEENEPLLCLGKQRQVLACRGSDASR
jgi:hypothetical protein